MGSKYDKHTQKRPGKSTELNINNNNKNNCADYALVKCKNPKIQKIKKSNFQKKFFKGC